MDTSEIESAYTIENSKLDFKRLAPWNWFKPSSKIVLLTVPRRYFFCGSSVLFVSCFLMLSRLFIAAFWPPAKKGPTSWLLLVMFIVFLFFPMWYPGSGVVLDCIVKTILIFAIFLTVISHAHWSCLNDYLLSSRTEYSHRTRVWKIQHHYQ